MNGDLRFTVLGPVRAWRLDDELTLGSPQQRAVLALLLIRAGQPVCLIWDSGTGTSPTC